MTDPKIQKAWIDAVKSCGQSLIDNAEKIAGDFDFQTETKISITLKPKEIVDISVTTSYVPRDINDKSIIASTAPTQERLIILGGRP